MPTLEALMDKCPGLLFIAEADGTLRSVSAAFTRRLGHRVEVDGQLSALVDADDAQTVGDFLSQLAGDDSSERSCSLRVPEASGGGYIELRCAGCRHDDGLIYGQLESVGSSVGRAAGRFEVGLLETLMQTLDIVLWAVDPEGEFVFQQGKALAAAGIEPSQFVGMNIFEIFPPDVSGPVRMAFEGRRTHNTKETHGVHWENWNLPFEMDGGMGCAGISLDITERVKTKHDLEQQLATIQSQQRAIHELSAPVLTVWDGVLAVPLIGIMDSKRTDELTERLLKVAHETQARFVILDLTGVEVVDTSIAAHLLRLLESLELLGVEAMISGVSPQVARTMVAVGIEFDEVMTHRSFREGLRYCMREIVAQG